MERLFRPEIGPKIKKKLLNQTLIIIYYKFKHFIVLQMILINNNKTYVQNYASEK